MSSKTVNLPEALVKALAPTVHLHPSDRYKPCSAVEWYLPRVSLWKENETKVLGEGEVTVESLLRAQKDGGGATLSMRVEPPPYDEIQPENPSYEGQGTSAPCYYIGRETENGLISLQYFFFYAYNGGLLANAAHEDGYEAHEGDWEYITVLLDLRHHNEARVHAVAYAGHGYVTHWEVFEDPVTKPFSELKSIQVYSALHSHASYASPGRHALRNIPAALRPLIGGYDEASADGPRWATHDHLQEIEPEAGTWADYRGDWGTDVEVGSGVPSVNLRTEGPTGPLSKDYALSDMGTVDVYYEPQHSQHFRCSDNFPNWHPPSSGYLDVSVETHGKPGVPVFAFDHDKVGWDTRWYSFKKGGDSFSPTSENGDGGGHAIYLGTQSPVPPGVVGSQRYRVTVGWSAVQEPAVPDPEPPENAVLNFTLGVSYRPQEGHHFRCSAYFDWHLKSSQALYFEVVLGAGQTSDPVFAIHQDDNEWYTGVTNGSYFCPEAQHGSRRGQKLSIGTVSPLPPGVQGSDKYTVNIYVVMNASCRS